MTTVVYRRSLPVMLVLISLILSFTRTVSAQTDQASLQLDLKRSRANYENARQEYENSQELYERGGISANELRRSEHQLLSAEIDYQKLMLRIIGEQSYVIVEQAVKYQTPTGERRVRITLKSTMEGNQDYLDQFSEHFDVFSPEMRTSRIYNIFVSLVNLDDHTIIGTPYEMRVPVLESGTTADADFGLLRDVESLQVKLSYGSKQDEKNIYLEKDASADIVDISCPQFSQEADLGANTVYNLSLERFSASDDVYTLIVLNLPRQVSYEFTDAESGARISQIRFGQGQNLRTLKLSTFLPDREDEHVSIDTPLVFHAVVLSREEAEALGSLPGRTFTQDEIEAISGGRVRLELVPRGVGRIEVQARTLYHEITAGDSVSMDITVRNDGTRRLDNIRVTSDDPLNWRSVIEPGLIRTLDPEQEVVVSLNFIPPDDVGVGAQEVKISTEALADNRRIESGDKTVRILVQARTPLLGTAILILFLIGLVIGIVVFGIKISRR